VGRYIKVALGLLAWMLLGALMTGCGDKTTQVLGEGPTPVAQAAIDLRPTLGATRALPMKGSALRESSTQARVGARPAAPRRAGGPGKPPSRATKQWVRPRTVDVLVWPRLREVRISSPALRDARFRARLVRLLEGARGVASARAGGSPVGASIYLRLGLRRPDPAPGARPHHAPDQGPSGEGRQGQAGARGQAGEASARGLRVPPATDQLGIAEGGLAYVT